MEPTTVGLITFIVSLISGWITTQLFDREPRDKRSIGEKNWDWIMGAELPSTCSQVGHSYVISPHECDWCGLERWVTIRAERVQEELTTYWLYRNLKLHFVTNELENYALMGSRKHVLVMPATAEIRDAYTNESYGIAGIFLDEEPSNVRSSEYEARAEAKKEANRAAERCRSTRRYEARRNARPTPPDTGHRPSSRHFGGSDLKLLEEKALERLARKKTHTEELERLRAMLQERKR